MVSITGLMASTGYQVRVAGVNIAGLGAFSSTISSTTTAPASSLDMVAGTQPAFALGLRKLRASFTGSAIRVVRSSDNAEADIGFATGGDLDTAALLAFAGTASCTVKTWYDQSIAAKDFTQGSAANRPAIVTSGTLNTKNGKPAVRFIGGTKFNRVDGWPVSNGKAADFTMALVASVEAASFSGNVSGSGGGTGFSILGGKTQFYDNTAFVAVAPAALVVSVLHTLGINFARSTAALAILQDGAVSGTATATVTGGGMNIADVTLGDSINTANYGALNGNVTEYIVFSGVLSAADQASLQANQKAYFGTPSLAGLAYFLPAPRTIGSHLLQRRTFPLTALGLWIFVPQNCQCCNPCSHCKRISAKRSGLIDRSGR